MSKKRWFCQRKTVSQPPSPLLMKKQHLQHRAKQQVWEGPLCVERWEWCPWQRLCYSLVKMLFKRTTSVQWTLHLPVYCRTTNVLKLSATSCVSNRHWEISAPLQQVNTSVTDQDLSVPGFAELRLSQRVYSKWHCSLQVLLEHWGRWFRTDFSARNLTELIPKDLVGPWVGSGHCGHVMVL